MICINIYIYTYIYIQTHKLGNTFDWLISNSPNTIQDITSKDCLLANSIIEWRFQIGKKVSEKNTKIKKRPNQNKCAKLQHSPEEEPGNRHGKNTSKKFLATIWMPLKRQWINMHHCTPKLKQKETITPGSIMIHKSSKHNER